MKKSRSVLYVTIALFGLCGVLGIGLAGSGCQCRQAAVYEEKSRIEQITLRFTELAQNIVRVGRPEESASESAIKTTAFKVQPGLAKEFEGLVLHVKVVPDPVPKDVLVQVRSGDGLRILCEDASVTRGKVDPIGVYSGSVPIE